MFELIQNNTQKQQNVEPMTLRNKRLSAQRNISNNWEIADQIGSKLLTTSCTHKWNLLPGLVGLRRDLISTVGNFFDKRIVGI